MRIELEAASGIQVEGVENALLAIAGGMAPDILSIKFSKSDNYIRNHFLYPLDEYYRTLSREEFRELVPEKLVPVIARRGDDGRQHCWLVPTGALLGRVLLYRKSLFDERRIAYPAAAWTWRELYQGATAPHTIRRRANGAARSIRRRRSRRSTSTPGSARNGGRTGAAESGAATY